MAYWTISWRGAPSAADQWREEAPVLAGIAEASVQGRRALGDRAGAAVRRYGHSEELLVLIEDPPVIRRILGHLGLPTEVPAARPARPPPLPLGRSDPNYDADDVMAP